MSTNRRLAAIMVADVVGYSRMMELDEAGTLAALKERRKGILEPVVKAHGGRIVKLMGDGVLVEFASAVNAVQGAIELQKQMAAANEGVEETKRIVLRIGINLGDVIGEGSDIYGEGVNIAARLESLAEPGGTVISNQILEAVRGRIETPFQDMGEQQLKNIDKPVRAYRIGTRMTTATILVTGATNKPSIAVLPFQNMSGDPEQAYFADGITEDIITELARFSSLLVIARNSSFQYRDHSFDMRRIGKELGARYLVEGSVRRLGTQVRITAQLIDAANGNHLWAERYDRKINDLFAVQDEVVRAVVTATEHRVTDTEAELAVRKPPSSWAAHDCYLQARRYLNDYIGYERAEQPLHRAIELDPLMGEAHAKLAHVWIGKYWDTLDDACVQTAAAFARKALSINGGLADAHNAMSITQAFQNRMDLAIVHAERAIALNPNDVLAATNLAQWLIFSGSPTVALERLDDVIKRDPIPPSWYWDTRGAALFQLKRYQEVLDGLAMVHKHQPWELAYIAASLAFLGRNEEARRKVEQLLADRPDMTIERMLKLERYQAAEEKAHFCEGLRKAGLPE
ncbi:MAG: adenylate/guanylate cyclase domain-containing protein [Hyphomicrobiales bacterium]